MIASKTYIASPPGATVKEQLQARGMSQKEFAIRMDMSEKHISNFINGDVVLTPDMAIRLEMVLGLSANFWNNLESIYREKLQLIKEENEMDEDIKLLKNYPYSEMAKFGWVENTKDATKRVFAMRKFFEVARLSLVNELLIPDIVYRRLGNNRKNDFILIAWVQKAKIESRKYITGPINIKKLKKRLNEIRNMTTEKPEEFCSKLTDLMADCGIALIFLPCIGGSFLHGATFYEKNKIVLGLTVRGKDADRFWFSLFHEIGHIVLGHINNNNGTDEDQENEADVFARDMIISPDLFKSFVENNVFTKTSIIDFSKKINIDKGIVVGRLQKEGYIKYNQFNDFKTQYELL